MLIVDKENGAGIYHSRLKRLKIDKTPRLHVWGLWNEKQPGGPTSSALLQFARDYKPLIVFDSFIAFHPGSEQDSSETRKYMDGFRRLASLGATVLVIHHTGKGENSKEYRGSSDIKASADAGFVLSGNHGSVESLKLKEFKQREGDGGGNRTISISLVDGCFVSSGDNTLGIVHEIIGGNPGIKSSEIVSQAMLKRASKHRVEAILREGEGKSFEVTKGPKNAKCYSLRPAVN